MKDEMVCLEPFDWRYSTAIVGLRKYLEWLGTEEPELIITEDTLEYNRKYLNKSEFSISSKECFTNFSLCSFLQSNSNFLSYSCFL